MSSFPVKRERKTSQSSFERRTAVTLIMKYLIVILSASFTGLVCEKFSAISEMEKLAYDEDLILGEFENFVTEMEREMEYLMT
jgi:hypothetical protein